MLSNGLLASSSLDESVKIWNLTSGSIIQDFTPYDSEIYQVRELADGTVIVCGDSKTAHRYNLSIGISTAQKLNSWLNINPDFECNQIVVFEETVILAIYDEVKLINQTNKMMFLDFSSLGEEDTITSLEIMKGK